jgi:prepilin-type N-terminal cleavage/methylation domain-containing protein
VKKMNRLLPDEGRRVPARTADEQGFTLIELLVAMLVSLIVIGGGVYGIARAFQQNTQVTNRVISSTTAEVGIQKLVIDLRYALNSSACPITVGVPASGVYTLSMCEQSGALSAAVSGTNTYPSFTSASTQVTWTCNTTASAYAYTSGAAPFSAPAETCNRNFGTGASSGTIGFHGIEALTLTGLVGTAGTNQAITSGSACTGTGTVTCTYSLSSGLANSLSWVGISATLADLKNPLVQADTTTVQTSDLIPVQTGAELRNFGT